MCLCLLCHNACVYDVIMLMTSLIDAIVSNIMLGQVFTIS